MAHLRWAVVGTSDFALDWVARGIRLATNAELAAVVSRDPGRAQAAAARVGASTWFTSISTIDRRLVDGVFIVLPNQLHAAATEEAAACGLHVIVEKPMAPTLAECQRMIAATNAAGVTLAVAHCMEWSPVITQARQLLAQGAIGKVLNANISASYTSPPDGSWRQDMPTVAGGGPLMDMGIHAIDAITRLIGPIEKIAALLEHKQYAYTADDSATLLLRFANGVHGMLSTSFTCVQNSFDIQGTHGRMWSNAWWGREFAGDLYLQQGNTATKLELTPALVYVPQIEHVSDSILHRESLILTGARGMANVAVVQAAIEAAQTKRWVAVSESTFSAL